MLKVFEEIDGDKFLQAQNVIKERLMAVRPSKLSDVFNFYTGSNRATKDSYEYRRKDHISHFLLRLYCCRTEELRKWFIWHERKFLQFQLLDEKNWPELDGFMRMHNFDYEEVTEPGDLLTVQKLLWDSASTNKVLLHAHLRKIFKVPFEEVLTMVQLRKVYLERGHAYVLAQDMVHLICTKFRVELSHALASMSRRLPILDEDDRLTPIIGSVYYDQVTKVEQMKKADEKLANRERITPDMINDLAKESFPPCMRSIHEQLRKNHHLKHYGRLHYSLFLKSIGLSLQDALHFFREEFIQTIAPEKFAKEYSYNIRYNYGQEGKRTSLSAYGCKKIINDNPPGPGDSHGCPFKHFDGDHLQVMLKRYGSDPEAIAEMMKLVEKKEYTASCTRFFKCKHPNYILRADPEEIYHPNQFYSESRRAHRGITNQPMDNGENDEENQENENKEHQSGNIDFFEDGLESDLNGVSDAIPTMQDIDGEDRDTPTNTEKSVTMDVEDEQPVLQ